MLPTLPEFIPPTGTRAMLYQMAGLLLRYPDETERHAAAERAGTPFLAEAPDLATVAEWLQLLGDDVSPEDLRRHFASPAPHA